MKILNNEYQIFRVKVPLVKGDNDELTLSVHESLWEKLGWKEGTMLEIRQDDKDNKLELTIRQAPKSLQDRGPSKPIPRLGTKK